MNSHIKFVYLDIGGVLMRWQGMIEAVAVKYGKTKTIIEESYFKYDDLACRGQLTTQNAWESMCRDLDLPHAKEIDFVAFCFETFTPIKNMHTLAKKIIRQYPLGLLTNIHPGAVELFLEKKLIPDLAYTAIIKSCDVGHIKPEKEIYTLAQKKTGVDHRHIFFADDFLQNITAARAMGWQAVQFHTDQPERSVKEIKKILKLK